MEKQQKQWFKKCICSVLGVFFLTGVIVWVVDPYFHFHKPFSFIRYRLKEERYINDGISRHFDFDAIVTGTSMTQNFKPSEIDSIFGTCSVKETFSGAGYQELSKNLDRALSRNKDLKTVFWGIDYNGLLRDYDWSTYDDYPTYLYDDNILNDVQYLFNKDVLYHGVLTNIALSLKRSESTSMDEYSSWDKATGLQYILNGYNRDETIPWENGEFTLEHQEMVKKNIQLNIVDLANKYPDVQFYLFYTPYSICYWDELNILHTLDRQIQAEELATSMILDCPNVALFNFYDQYEIVTDTDNYRDKEHYSAQINSQILQWIHDGTGLVTKNNYKELIENEKNFYGSYDYESIYKR